MRREDRQTRQKTPKPVGGLDRCLLIRFLRVISVVEHRKPTETVEAEIQPSDGFPYRRTKSQVAPHLLSWHSGSRPLFGLSFASSAAAATKLSNPSSYVGVERLLPHVIIPAKTRTSRSALKFFSWRSARFHLVNSATQMLQADLQLGSGISRNRAQEECQVYSFPF